MNGQFEPIRTRAFAGRLREAQRVGQQAYDIVYMDCLAREFLATEKAST
jgi:hypothetical protein